MITNDNFEQYIADWYAHSDERVKQLESYAKTNHVPIMDPYGMAVMLSYMTAKKHKRILEIGTAIGYSAIRMAIELPEVQIVTIERDKERYEEALKNIADFHLTDRITVLFGDALETEGVVAQHAPYDGMFIDAAKGQYTKFFEMYTPYCTTDALVYTDNVLFKGHVMAVDDAHIPQKQQALVKKIRTYNAWLHDHPEWTSVLLPVGDGLFVSQRKRGEV
ncbi:MAG: O-methyltransferase [Bacilli bacterium]